MGGFHAVRTLRRVHGLTHLELLICFAVLSTVGSIVLVGLVPAGKSRRATCVNNLRHLGLALALYANENRDRFPPLDERDGNLMFDGTHMFPEFLSNVAVLGCPSDPRFDPARSFRLRTATTHHRGYRPGEPHADCLDSASYMYLATVVVDHDQLRRFPGWKSRRIRVPVTNGRRGAMPTGSKNESASPARATFAVRDTVVPPARASAPRLLMHEAQVARVQATFASRQIPGAGGVPIMWDRPAIGAAALSHGSGQNVLYLDGHVEFIRFLDSNDRFPATPYSHAWMASQIPAPVGNVREPWGDCEPILSSRVDLRWRNELLSSPVFAIAVMLLGVAALYVVTRRPGEGGLSGG